MWFCMYRLAKSISISDSAAIVGSDYVVARVRRGWDGCFLARKRRSRDRGHCNCRNLGKHLNSVSVLWKVYIACSYRSFIRP